MKKFNYILILTLLACCMLFGISKTSYAADGKLTIAVSKESVSVGDTVTVTLHAAGPNGEAATSSMEFTYDSGVCSFVSCDSSNYSGGEGGKVNVSGETVKITLKAIASGTCGLKVTAASGTIKSSQETLSGMVAAGASIKSGDSSGSDGPKSGDNSLAELSLSAGELSPAFVYNVTEYTATVPYEVASLEVNARPSNSKAEVESIQGNGELNVGENTVSVTVKAENGAKAVYKIVVTRQEGTGTPGETADPNGTTQGGTADPNGTVPGGAEGGQLPEGADAPATNTSIENGGTSQDLTPSETQAEEYEQQLKGLKEDYQELEKKFKRQKTTFYIIFAVMLVVIVLLGIICVNLFLFRKRRRDPEETDDSEWYDDEDSGPEETLEEAFDGEEPVKPAKEKNKHTFWKRKKEERWYDEDEEEDDFLESWEPQEEKEKPSEEIEIIDMDDL